MHTHTHMYVYVDECMYIFKRVYMCKMHACACLHAIFCAHVKYQCGQCACACASQSRQCASACPKSDPCVNFSSSQPSSPWHQGLLAEGPNLLQLIDISAPRNPAWCTLTSSRRTVFVAPTWAAVGIDKQIVLTFRDTAH